MFKNLLLKSNIIRLFCLIIVFTWNTCFLNAQTDENTIRVGLFVDKGAHAHTLLCNTLKNDKNIRLSYITGDDICSGCLNDLDLVFFPGGSGKQEALSLTKEGKNKVRNFIRNGGIYIGVCAGCYLASCTHPEYMALIPMSNVDPKHWRRGKATLPIEFTNLGMEIFGATQKRVEVVYHNGPVLKAFENCSDQVVPLSYYRGEVAAPGGRAGLMVNAPAMVLGRYGNGLVLAISPHPEATPGLTSLEPHAIHWLFNHRTKNVMQSNINNPMVALLHPNQVYAKMAAPPRGANNNQTNKLAINLSEQIYDAAQNIFNNAISSHYQHLHESAEEQIQKRSGAYIATTDCSGFVSYVINSIAPKHYDVIFNMAGHTYPHANIYAQFFSQLPDSVSFKGWIRVSNYKDLKRGDIIAWQRTKNQSASSKHKGSGHVMIVANSPSNLVLANYKNRSIKYIDIFVLDSSSVEHFPPQVLPPLAHQQNRDGIGKGTIRLILDDNDNVIGFWEGIFSHEKNGDIKGPSFTNKVAFGRLVSFNDRLSNNN